MFNQIIIGNKFDLNLSTTLSSYYFKKGAVTVDHIFLTKVNVTEVTSPLAYLKKVLSLLVTSSILR